MAAPNSPVLSASQLATLAKLGEERTAAVGDVLYRVGAQRYPFIAIVEGEVAILDPAGHELARHGPSRFLGELNLLSGQTVFLTAMVTQPLRYIAVDRDVMRERLFEDGPLSDLVLSTFIARREALQTVGGLGLDIVGPRASVATMRLLEFARSNLIPFAWRDEEPADGAGLWCGCRAARRCMLPRPVRCRARSASGGSSLRAKRSTSSWSAPVRRVWAPPSTGRPKVSRRS